MTLDEAPDRLVLAASQWAKANLVRIALVLTFWICVVSVLIQRAAEHEKSGNGPINSNFNSAPCWPVAVQRQGQ